MIRKSKLKALRDLHAVVGVPPASRAERTARAIMALKYPQYASTFLPKTRKITSAETPIPDDNNQD